MLPSHTSLENYLVNYMPQDFSQGDKQITNMKYLFDENNQELANAFAAYLGLMASGRSMRCSFEVNGIPAEGSFTIVATDLMGYSTTIDLLAGMYAPENEFDIDTLVLIDIFKSIRIMPQYRNICTPTIGGCCKCIGEECCGHPCDKNGRCD